MSLTLNDIFNVRRARLAIEVETCRNCDRLHNCGECDTMLPLTCDRWELDSESIRADEAATQSMVDEGRTSATR